MPKLATKATSFILDKFERKISGQGAVRAGKRFILFISNEDVDDIIKIVKPLENSGLLIHETSKTAKYEMKKGGFLLAIMATIAASLIAPTAASKCYNWKKSHECRKRARRWISCIISITCIDKSSRNKSHNGREIIQ